MVGEVLMFGSLVLLNSIFGWKFWITNEVGFLHICKIATWVEL